MISLSSVHVRGRTEILETRREIKRGVVGGRGRRGLGVRAPARFRTLDRGIRRVPTHRTREEEVSRRIHEQRHEVGRVKRVRVVHRLSPAETNRVNVGAGAYQRHRAPVVPPRRGGVQRGESLVVTCVDVRAVNRHQPGDHVDKGWRRDRLYGCVGGFSFGRDVECRFGSEVAAAVGHRRAVQRGASVDVAGVGVRAAVQ